MLRRRLEEQEHWRKADSVRDGRQPRVDPDKDELVMLGDDIRVYSLVRTRGPARRWCKRLVDGIWQYGVIDVPDEVRAASENPKHASDVAHVA
jgi:hypothetical protein